MKYKIMKSVLIDSHLDHCLRATAASLGIPISTLIRDGFGGVSQRKQGTPPGGHGSGQNDGCPDRISAQ